MKLKKNILFLAVAAAMMAVMTSCGSQRNTVVAPQNIAGSGTGSVSASGNTEVTDWYNLYIPARVVVKTQKSLSLPARVTMVRDSVINISMRMLGMEVAAVQITPDSVWVVDKFHKYVFSDDTRQLLGKYDISMGQIQNLLLGIGGEGSEALSYAAGGTIVEVAYGDFVTVPAGSMATELTIDARLPKQRITGSLEWQTDQAVWNDPSRTVKFNTSFRGYTRVGRQQVAAILKGL